MTRLEAAILKLPPVKVISNWAKRVVLPGFQGVSLFDVAGFFVKEVSNTKINVRAAAVTYNFLMAIPPTLLFLFSLIPYLPLGDVEVTMLDTLKLLALPPAIYKSLSGLIIDFMNTERKDLLSYGILLTLFFSSNGMMGLMNSFDRATTIHIQRSGLKRRWTAIKLTVMLICVAVISLAALILQSEALNGLILSVFNNVIVVKLLSMLILISLIFTMISLIYTYGPSLVHKFSFVSPGSVFATVLSVITTVVFFFLVNNFINYNKVYGSIGTLMAFMVWVWLNTMVILLGFELNVSILLGKFSNNEVKAKQHNK
ncbi:MAG TPA: YihY/virulence factor BrkB family protein [Flavipsychrobacter sp.]|nr:YihY/virulence factor BrkB family protein [Chitinophagales bacterium]HLO69748.1 YihY/virulence factor BrkB family protein [Flavipsychrobacter sp.]